MSQPRQLPLFLPQQEAEINRHTLLSAIPAALPATPATFRQVWLHLACLHLRPGVAGPTCARRSAAGRLYDGTSARVSRPGWSTAAACPAAVNPGRDASPTLKVYFAWLRSLDAIDHDPAAAIAQRSGPAPLASVLTPAERARALAAAKHAGVGERADARPELLLRLLLETGIKKGETARLRREDFRARQ